MQRAIGLYEQHLVIAREIGDRQGEGAALGNLGLAYARLGEVQRAIGLYEQHLVIAREIGDRQGEAETCWNYGHALMAQGETVQALGLLEAGLSFFASIAHPRAAGMATVVDYVRQHGTLPSAQPSDIPVSVRAALEQQDQTALEHALAMLPAGERVRVEQMLLEQMVAQQPPRELRELLAELPEQVRHAFEQGDDVALQAALQTLSPEQQQSAALALAQIQVHQRRATQTDPRKRFAPLLQAIAHVASGDDTARTQIEAELAKLESNGWHLSAAAQHLWAGERDLTTLTSGLDEQDTLLVEHMLELVGAYERGERQTPSQLLAALPEALREAFTQQDQAAFDAALATLPDDERERIAPLLAVLAEEQGAAAPDTDDVPEPAPAGPDMVQITQAFLPTLGDIALAAHGDRIARALAEAALPRLEAAGWHLTEPVQRIWAGLRDEAALTANIDPRSTHLVRRILALIAGGPAMIFAAGSIQIATLRQQATAATEQALAAGDAEQRVSLAGTLEQQAQQVEQQADEIAPWRDLAAELRTMAAQLRAG